LKKTLSLDDVVNFVLSVMPVRRLSLTRFKTINIADKPIRPKQHIFFHLVGGELLGFGKTFEHRFFPKWLY
jgi:hypothetical protein